MIDYLFWRGDLSFRNDPFNEVDNMLFAQMSYLDFEACFHGEKYLTLKDLSKRYFADRDITQIGTEKNASKSVAYMLYLMARSKRFEKCRVHDCISETHNEKDLVERFAAMMIDLDDHTTVVVFRGTDDSLISWKEDLMLSYRDIASQYDALAYVNQHCRFWRRYRFIGHSKGGYLAIYAAAHCNYLLQRRIIEVYSDDGPGLRSESYDLDKYERIKDRYKLIVPAKDGVGTIYEMAENKKIAQISVFNIIAAHNMMTWQVEGNHVLEADKNAYETDLSRKSILKFLEETNTSQRAVFVEEFFNVLAEMNISSVTEFSGPVVISKIMSRMSRMDDEAKSTAGKMIRAFTDNIGSDLQKSISDSTEQIRNRFFRKKTDDAEIKLNQEKETLEEETTEL